MLYLCFINPCCWCFSCCCLKDYTDEDDPIPDPSLSNPYGDSDKSKKNKKPKSKNGCCSCCCCCCGIKCGYCVVTFSFLCCIVAMFFAIFAFANHPLSGYPNRLIGDVNTNEEHGITRITNSLSDFGQSALILVKSQVFSNLLFNVVGNNTLAQLMTIFTSNFEMKVLADGVNSTVKILNSLPMGSTIEGNISQIENAINIFPNESYVNSQINIFNGNVDKLTDSMNKTKETMKECHTNSGKINTTVLEENDMKDLDELVWQSSTISVDNLKDIATVPSNIDVFMEGGDCVGLLDDDDNCRENMTEIIDYFEKCNKADINITNNIYNERDKYTRAFSNNIEKFKNIQDAVDGVELTQLTSDTLKEFQTDGLDSLRNILNEINNTINSLPDFNVLADSINDILGVTDVIPRLQTILDEFKRLTDNLVNIDMIGEITTKFDDIKGQLNKLNESVGGVIGDIKGLNDRIKNDVNMTEFYDIIDVQVKKAIDDVMNQVNFSQIIEQLENITENASKYIFKIHDVSTDFKEKLKIFSDKSSDSDKLKTFSKRYVDDNLLNYFRSYSNESGCGDSCKKAIKLYFSDYKDTKDADYDPLITSVKQLNDLTKNFTPVDDKIIPYSTYKAFVKEYANTIGDVTKDDKQDQITTAITNIKDNTNTVGNDLPKQLDPIRETLTQVPLNTVKDNLDMYKQYRDNLGDIKELYKEVTGSDFPSKDYFEDKELMGRVGNLFLNPLLDRANTLDDVISILYDLVNLINDLPKELEKLPTIKCDKFNNMIDGIEDWIIKVIENIYSNTTSFNTFFKKDTDYVEYKNIFINFDKNEEPYKGLYYLLYLISVGGKNSMEGFDTLMKRTEGFIKEKGNDDITCVTNKCIKESITDVWNNGNVEAMIHLDQLDDVNTEKYFKIGTIALGIIQSIVIILPFFLLVLEILYLVFRCKGHNCCCECMFSCNICCGVIVLLLFSILGSFAIFPMLVCNLTPDAANLMIKDEKVINKIEEIVKDIGTGDDLHLSYIRENNSIALNGIIMDTRIDVTLSIDDLVKGYLGGCKGDTAKPLEKSKDNIVQFINDVLNTKILDSVRDKLDETTMLKQKLKEPINNLLDKEIFTVIDSIGSGIVDNGGPLDCKTIHGILNDVGELACCDIMNDIIAIGSTSYLFYLLLLNRIFIAMFMFLSAFCLPCSNICLGKGNLSEYKRKNKILM